MATITLVGVALFFSFPLWGFVWDWFWYGRRGVTPPWVLPPIQGQRTMNVWAIYALGTKPKQKKEE